MIAAIKNVTIPRLELCGVHLLTMSSWSDSAIVLCWIQKPPSTIKEYVTNLVAYIQENSDKNDWKLIRSESNSTDCAIRGLSPAFLEDHRLWWTGPKCIHQGMDCKMSLPSSTEKEEHFSIAESCPVFIFVFRLD